MKLLKVLTIILLSVSLFFSVSYTQENNTGAVIDNLQNNNKSGDVPAAEIEKTVTTPTKKETETADKKQPSIPEHKSENRKKEKPEKKVTAAPVEDKEENTEQVKAEGDLLPINEGNFKYKRIPDIKLVDITPETTNSGSLISEKPGQSNEVNTGFLGLSKTASDVIVKGGVLLLILIIFIIYKTRMSGPGGKSSKRRNVLNSYRK